MVKNLPAMQETRVSSLGQEDPLEKGKVTHFSILAWRIPWTDEPGGLQPMRSQRVGTWFSSWHFTTSAKPPYLVSRTDSGSNPSIYCTGLENQCPLFSVLSTFIRHTGIISVKREGHCHSYANPQAYVLPSKTDCMLLKPRCISYRYIFLVLFAPSHTNIHLVNLVIWLIWEIIYLGSQPYLVAFSKFYDAKYTDMPYFKDAYNHSLGNSDPSN